MSVSKTTLTDMSPSSLARFIKDVFRTDPPTTLSKLTLDTLTVNKLTIGDEVFFTKRPNFQTVGGTGSAKYQNGWSGSAAYWLDPVGFVILQGTISGGTVGQAAFTLPPGPRPPATAGPFAVYSNGGFGAVEVTATGQVIPMSPSSNVSVSLFGIRFRI